MRVGFHLPVPAAWLGAALCTALSHVARPASAGAAAPTTVELLRTVVSTDDRAQCAPPAPADSGSQPNVAQAALRVDEALAEAARDLGLTPTEREIKSDIVIGPSELRASSTADWVLLPKLVLHDQTIELSLTAAPPGTKVVFVRSQVVTLDALELRATVMLRDLLQATQHSQRPSPEPRPTTVTSSAEPHALTMRSEGRAQLALNAGLFGGYIGWTLQRTSGSSDVRLTYPLVALGAAVGLGASMVVADEWDVGVGEAWYVSAGTWWPMASAILLSDAYHVTPSQNRFAYGLLGATVGTALATTSVALTEINQGGAFLAHSGGAFGSILGGVSQLIKRGSTEEFPSRGAGFGTAIGVVGAGVLATQVQVDPSRLLFIDLGASLGALVGAAAASPLLLVDEEQEAWRTRAWLSAVGSGLIAGGTAGFLLTDSATESAASKPEPLRAWPSLGVVDVAAGTDGTLHPAFGAGVQGIW